MNSYIYMYRYTYYIPTSSTKLAEKVPAKLWQRDQLDINFAQYLHSLVWTRGSLEIHLRTALQACEPDKVTKQLPWQPLLCLNRVEHSLMQKELASWSRNWICTIFSSQP